MTSFSHILAQPLAYRIGWTLVNSIWQGALTAFVLGAILLLLRRREPNVRYLAACVALVVMPLLSIGTFYYSGPQGGFVNTPNITAAIHGPVSPAEAPNDASPHAHGEPSSVQADTTGAGKANIRSVWSSADTQFRSFLEPALPWFALAWALGVMSLSLRTLGGWIHLERLRRRRATVITGRCRTTLDQLAARLGVRRVVLLLESPLVESPLVFGWWRPVILLPLASLIGLTDQQLEAVLAHELAHIRRGDYAIRILQTVIECLFFYHPAAWWISRQISIEREYCCDDLAVQACGNALGYARTLADLAEARNATPQIALAATGGSLFARVQRLVSPATDAAPKTAWLEGSVLAIALVAVLAGVTVYFSVAAAARPVAEAALEMQAESSLAMAAAVAGVEPTSSNCAAAIARMAENAASRLPGNTVAVFPFPYTDGIKSVEGGLLAERIATELVSAGALKVLDRGMLDRAMAEQKLGAPGLADPATSVRIGKLLNAHGILCGTVTDLGEWLEIHARLVNVESGEIAATCVEKARKTVKTFTNPLWEQIDHIKDTGKSFSATLWAGASDFSTEAPSCRIGELVSLRFTVERDCHVTIFDFTTSGTIHVLFPNAFMKDNKVVAGREYIIPGPEDGFNIRATGPPGIERLKLFATTQDLPLFEENYAQESFRSVTGATYNVTRDLEAVVKSLEGNQWAESSLELSIEQVLRNASGPPN